MNRNESLQLQLATIIQEGHTAKATSYETAGRVLELLSAEEDAERVNLHWPRFAVLPETLPMAGDLLLQPRLLPQA